MRLAFGLCFLSLLLGQAEADPANEGRLIIFVAESGSLSTAQLSKLQQQGWNVLHLQVQQGITRGYLQSAAEAPRAVFPGTDGRIRRNVRVNGPEDVLDLVNKLDQGRLIFEYACARCHGTDGSSETYAGIRTLVGIGSRLNKEQITERLHPLPMGMSSYSVRGHVLRRDQLENLVAWISGL